MLYRRQGGIVGAAFLLRFRLGMVDLVARVRALCSYLILYIYTVLDLGLRDI
jgi:hypothetical protein